MPFIKQKELAKLTDKEKAEKIAKRKDIWLRVIYYVDECSILLFSVVAVVCSDVIQKKVRGELIFVGDLSLDLFNLGISALLALITYGTLFTKFQYNDNTKPSYIKRLANAILQGVAWRSIIGYTE